MAADLLSEALALVRLTGVVMYRIDIQGPWGIAVDPTLERFASLLSPGTNHLIAFHILLDGSCWMRRPSVDWTRIAAGEAVVFTDAGPHELADRPDRAIIPLDAALGGRSIREIRDERFETGPGASTSILCGFLGCDRRAFDPLCRALPPMFVVDLGPRMDTLVHHAVEYALEDSPGTATLRSRLAELLFLSALRMYMQDLPADATGWLAGLRDPLVGRALAALHQNPSRRWSVEDLAGATASSRSALAERFSETIGEPPMHYLTRLRMQLAARRLSESRLSIDSVADEVGYDSSAAFQRAFKRCFGVPPAAWRRRVEIDR